MPKEPASCCPHCSAIDSSEEYIDTNREKSLRCCRCDRVILLDEGSTRHPIRVIRTAVQIALDRGDFQTALQKATHAAEHFAEAGDEVGQATALYLEGITYRYLENCPASLKALEASRHLWEYLKDDRGILETLQETAATLMHRANYVESLRYLQQCRIVAHRLGDEYVRMAVMIPITTIYIQTGNIEAALDILQHQCLPYFEHNGRTLSIARTLFNIATIDSLLGNYAEAIRHLQHCQIIYQQPGEEIRLAQVFGDLGAAYTKLGRWELAFVCLKRAVRIAQKTGVPWIEALVLEDMGELLTAIGWYTDAKAALERALTLNSARGHLFIYTQGLARLGALYTCSAFEESDEGQALHFLVEARQIAEGCDSPILLTPVYTVLVEIQERRGNITEALHCQRLLHQMEKRLFYVGGKQLVRDLPAVTESDRTPAEAELAYLRTQELARALQESEQLTIELRKEKEQLQLSEERLRALVTASEMMTWAVDASGQVDMDIPAWREFTGQSREDVRGNGWMNALHPADRESAHQTAIEAYRAGQPFLIEYRVRRWDGVWRWMGSRVAPVRGADGEIREWIGASRDITERKEREEKWWRQAHHNQRIADVLQEAVLPALPDQIVPGLSVRAFHQPASDEATIGGDFYDAFPLSTGEIVLVVGDVIGHGLNAALSIAQIRFALRAFFSAENSSVDLGAILAKLNHFLIQANERQWNLPQGDLRYNRLVAVTLVTINLADGELCVAVAGMEPALLIHKEVGPHEEKIVRLDAEGLILGAMADASYPTKRFRISPGDLVAITTDGITESFSPGGAQQFGLEGLGISLSAALAANAVSLGSLGETVLSAARTFIGGNFRDDVCLLLTRIGSD